MLTKLSPNNPPTEVEKEARELLAVFFAEKFPELVEGWEGLTIAEKWNAMLRLLPYIAPKLSAVTVKSSDRNAISTLIDLASASAQKT